MSQITQLIASRKAFLPIYLRSGLIFNDLGILLGVAGVIYSFFHQSASFGLLSVALTADNLFDGLRRLKSQGTYGSTN